MTEVEVPRCTAKTSAGRPCKQRPIRGGTVCATHGGSAAQVRAAAERRLVKAEAASLVSRLLHNAEAEPVIDPIAKLAKVAGQMEHAFDVLGQQVNELDHLAYTDALGVRRLQVVMEAYQQMQAEYRRTLTDMARLGITVEVLRLNQERPTQEQADALKRVMSRMLADPRVSIEPGDVHLVVADALRTEGLAA